MGFKDNSGKDKQYDKSEFVDELINENIGLMEENMRLTYENKILRRKNMYLESLNNRGRENPLVKKDGDYTVILIAKDNQRYKN